MAVALAATLFHPTLTTLLKSGAPVAFLGLPVSSVSYASSVIPILLAVLLLSYVERFIDRLMPAVLKTMFVPLLSLVIVAPVTLIAIGPAGILLGNALSGGIIWLVANMGWLAGVIVGGTLSLMIITGMHYVLVPIVINNISKLGYDPFKILFYVANMGQAGAAFGVFLRARNKKSKRWRSPQASAPRWASPSLRCMALTFALSAPSPRRSSAVPAAARLRWRSA